MVYVNLGLGVLAMILAIIVLTKICAVFRSRWRRQTCSRVAPVPKTSKVSAVNGSHATPDQNTTTQLSHIRNETNGAILTLDDISAISGRSFDTPLESPLATPNHHRN